VLQIYALQPEDFEKIGFGEKQSKNLRRELDRSLTQSIEDWRLIAALGISNLGKGDSRKLLEIKPLKEAINMTASEIEEIKGFGEITSPYIAEKFVELKDEITAIIEMGFNLKITQLLKDREPINTDSPIAGKKIIFSGTMTEKDGMKASVVRKMYQEEAVSKYNATLQGSVNKSTDIFVCGEKVGPTKIEKAKKLGVTILTEGEYLNLIAN